jgi:hypothetical protein
MHVHYFYDNAVDIRRKKLTLLEITPPIPLIILPRMGLLSYTPFLFKSDIFRLCKLLWFMGGKHKKCALLDECWGFKFILIKVRTKIRLTLVSILG